MKNVELSDQTFNKISEQIYKEIGVKLNPTKKNMVRARLMKRLRTLNIKSFKEYYEYANKNHEELVHLYNYLTTNTTHFFREDYHFDYLTSTVLPEINAKNRKKVRVWSAGCSSGQEPYTLSIVLNEYFHSSWNIQILATDINTDVLNRAKRGIYTKETVKKVPYHLLKKHFLLGKGSNNGLFKVKKHLKKNITFGRLNLKDNNYPIKEKVDVIFCRNVFIYFDKKTQMEIIKRYHRYLKPGGYLFLGHSETINLSEEKKLFQLVYKTTYKKIGGFNE